MKLLARSVVIGLILVFGLISHASAAIPDMKHVVVATAQRYPAIYALAHKDYNLGQGLPGHATKAQAELFVRLVAYQLNVVSVGTEHANRWGVNGKRGNPNDLSQDVISYRIRPDWNQGFDVIYAAGASNAQIVWYAFGPPDSPSNDSKGYWIQGTAVSEAEIAHILAGGSSNGPPSVSLGEAAATIVDAFQAKHQRAMYPEEIAAIGAYAQSIGWSGGASMPKSVVDEIVKIINRYSGDLNNPFPSVSPDVALQQITTKFQTKFERDMHSVEIQALVSLATSSGWNGVGSLPVWLLNELHAWVDNYDGSLVVGLPEPIDPLSVPKNVNGELTLNGEYHEWLGQTAFMLQYEYFTDMPRFVAAVDAMVQARVTVARVGITVATGYLELRPKSSGTFGSGRTRPLHPGNTPNFWPRYREMLAYLAQRGIMAEVVPFLTSGPYNPQGESCGARSNDDTSVPQSLSAAARMTYIEETARELMTFRAMLVEIANEYMLIGFCVDGHEVTRLAARYKELDPERQVTTSAYHPAFGDYRTIHPARYTLPNSWTWILEQLKYPQAGVHTVNDEGINADLVGEYGADATPDNHWANGVLHRLTPGLSYTFHFDRALKGLPPSTIDGSLQAITAWRDGTSAVPFNPQGQYYAVPGALSADATIVRLDVSEGWLLLIGSRAPLGPTLEGWTVELREQRGPHRLYRLTR